MKAGLFDAYKLFHRGALALREIEAHGIRVDLDYCKRMKQELTSEIEDRTQQFQQSSLWGLWQKVYGDNANIHSNHQLSYLLYKIKKFKPPKTTSSGQGSTDEESLLLIPLPELKLLVEIRKLKKIRDTYLEAFVREQTNGYLHPFFNLHTVVTYRSSSDRPNFQNIPRRDKKANEICRRALFPRPGHQLLESDFSGLEVAISACYHRDPKMLEYLNSPDADLHADMAKQIFFLSQIDKSNPTHKLLRHAAKNGFVFPQFYGDYYLNNAESIANMLELPTNNSRWTEKDGIALEGDETVGKHFIEHGIKSFSQFCKHMEDVEFDFWNRRFPVYNKWRKDWWERYRKRTYIEYFTGFRCYGLMEKNEVINYAIQGTAFHCLLQTLIRVNEIAKQEKWDSRIVGQIHDSVVVDVHPDELPRVVEVLQYVTGTELKEMWPWIIVPLSIETKVAPVDCSWYEAKELT